MAIDQIGAQAAVRFVFAWARAGLSVEKLMSLVSATAETLPAFAQRKDSKAQLDVNGPPHVLTVWRSHPAYLHNGRPRPLPLRGRGPSVESLVREVSTDWKADSVVRVLKKARVLKQVGRRYMPVEAAVSYRGSPQQPIHHMRTLNRFLRNTEYNSAPRNRWPSWFDFTAEAPDYPISELDALSKYVNKHAHGFLKNVDEYMHRKERARAPRERTTRVTLTVFQNHDDPPEASEQYRAVMRKVTPLLRTEKDRISQRAPSHRSTRGSASRRR